MQSRPLEVAPGASRSRSFRLVVPPNPRYGKFVRERMEQFCRSLAVPETDLREFLTAVGEALANAFEHARSSEKIEAACWLVGSDQLVATIVDAGIGFRTAGIADAPADPEPTAERGRGFAIMHRCTDYVAIRSSPGRGTAVVLTRFIRRCGLPARMGCARTG
jgi:anti-sigma regulatory factor (Ser/Thr protein kinase)